MRIRWSEPAAQDLTRICDYLQEHDNVTTARRVALHIFDRVTSLSEFSERGRPGLKAGTRELLISGLPYIAVYRLRGGAVEILRIFHSAQHRP